MSNNELLEKMTKKFGIRKTTEFAQMVSYMYNVLHENDEPGVFSENSYEHGVLDLTFEKYKEIVKLLDK